MNSLPIILEEQFKLYKDIQVQDVYKLIYQGIFGCEHAVDEKSRERLYEEFEMAEPNEKEKVTEKISDFLIYRINIRPYKALEGEKETLFEWFYESSKMKEGTIKEFLINWKVFRLVNEHKHYFLDKEIKDFEKIIKQEYSKRKQLPLVHHSEEYRKANNPSYRVINYMALHEHMKRNMTSQ